MSPLVIQNTTDFKDLSSRNVIEPNTPVDEFYRSVEYSGKKYVNNVSALKTANKPEEESDTSAIQASQFAKEPFQANLPAK